MDAFVAGTSSGLSLAGKVRKIYHRWAGKENRKKGKHPPASFFPAATSLQQAAGALRVEMDRQLLFLKGEIFRPFGRNCRFGSRRRNIQSFDDLLTRLRRSLEKAGGDELSETIRKRYKAALIDEFQDTDPVQYAIFQNVFGKGGSILFLIGDPKQAIYSFRGADLFAYMKAAGRVDHRYTLDRELALRTGTDCRGQHGLWQPGKPFPLPGDSF